MKHLIQDSEIEEMLLKTSSKAKFGLNIKSCIVLMGECEDLMHLCEQTNECLSPLMIIHFANQMMLLISYAYIASGIMFAKWSLRIIFMVNVYKLNKDIHIL